MRLLKRIFFALRPRKRGGTGYGADVLFAGWVDLPAAFYPNSSIERGQLFLSSRESARSARTRPPVWQRAQ